jgi:hypothetical protein
MLSIGSPEEARESVKALNEWADADESRLRRAVRAATSAANRARAATRRRALSEREQKAMVQVEQTYRRYAERTSQRLARLAQPTARPGPRGRTIFFPPKDKTLADIITIRSPEGAKESVRQLDEWADDNPDRVRKAIRSATLAANRAEASTKRKTRPLSPKEREEMLQVAQIYRGFVRTLSEKLDELKREAPRYAGERRAVTRYTPEAHAP